MGFEKNIIEEKECGCHTVKTTHDFFNDTSYDKKYCDEHSAVINEIKMSFFVP